MKYVICQERRRGMGNIDNYYLGLDMGTSSLGWALTNLNYELLRARGKDLWGVRLFEEADTARDRRTSRTARRRHAREKARIGVVKELFADEIQKVDPGFFIRCDESKYHFEDRSANNQQPFALFADSGYTDREYYQQYPTIFHLRKELIENREPHDVRLVYLAILNMFHHRGHFLESGKINVENENSYQDLFCQLCSIAEKIEYEFPKSIATDEIETILNQKDISRTGKCEQILSVLDLSKTKDKKATEVIKMICGLSAKNAILFENEILDEELKKKSVSFRDSDFDEKIGEIEKEVSNETMEFLCVAKEIHDIALLRNIRGNYTYLSQARVADYQKHKKDLKLLQQLVREYVPEEYDNFFRVMEKDNYSAYVGSVNSKKEKKRRNELRNGKPLPIGEFYKSVEKLLEHMPSEDKRVQQIQTDIDNETFLPKQLTTANGVIPNQLHAAELKMILKNASSYLEFLNKKDDTGLTVAEKIVQLFCFQIPYYVGPLNPLHKNNGGTGWVVRKEMGQVLPWNFEEKIDVKQSRQEFIERMMRRCTYLSDERVLPKNSLLYEKFMVLNELNNLRIHDCKLDVEFKQTMYKELFESGKKVRKKTLIEYLVAKGEIQKGEEEAISGIDGEFQASLSSLGKFIGVLGERAKEWKMQQVIEDIIFWGTVYSNDKKVVKECILEKYPDVFSEKELKRILGFKFKDWGKFSKEFLEFQGASCDSGEILSIIQMLWETNDNLMQLLSERYTFKEELEQKMHQSEKLLAELTYEDIAELNLSAPVRRMVWQTILVLQDIKKVIPTEPDKIFIEMARGGGEKGTRTVSRKKRFQELYKNCAKQEKELVKSLEQWDDSTLRQKKLYLYYMQKGRCMYTGEEIDLEKLLKDNDSYDIDHIYPRHYVKDDNIDNNLVLVKKSINAEKSDIFPLDSTMQKNRYDWWKTLHQQHFINDEKFKRLTRKEPFGDDELAGFISRQLVETHQGTKVISQILNAAYPNAKIIFPKGGNVSEFRKKYDLLKVRNVNDFHHAQDAYLNIVVGNSYYTKFTLSPLNYIREYNKDRKKYAYNMDKIFDRDIERNGTIAWIAQDNEKGKSGTIVTVKKMMEKNTPIITRMNYENHGGIANQTVYSAKKAKENVYLPLKNKNDKLGDVTKYGGVTSISTAYYFLVEHTVKKKRVRTIETVPIYLKQKIESSQDGFIKYCENVLGLTEPKICYSKIKMQSLIKWNGFYLHLGGRTGSQILVRNAVSMCLSQDWINYIKKLNKIVEYDYEIEEVTKEKNMELFDIVEQKHTTGIYAKKPNSLEKKIGSWKMVFETVDMSRQAAILVELLKLTENANNAINIPEFDAKNSPMKIGNNVTNADEFLLINQSPSGLFQNVVDLKTV